MSVTPVKDSISASESLDSKSSNVANHDLSDLEKAQSNDLTSNSAEALTEIHAKGIKVGFNIPDSENADSKSSSNLGNHDLSDLEKAQSNDLTNKDAEALTEVETVNKGNDGVRGEWWDKRRLKNLVS